MSLLCILTKTLTTELTTGRQYKKGLLCNFAKTIEKRAQEFIFR